MARKPADQSVNKTDILAAAADVLRRKGYDATTMKDIAAQVNLTAASLYHHFKNKDFLLLSVLELGLRLAIEQMQPIVTSHHTAAEKLRQMIHNHIVSVTANPTVGAAMVFEIRSLINIKPSQIDQEFMDRRDAFFKERDAFERLFRHVIVEGMAQGEFRTVDAPVVVRAMLGAHNWVGVWYRETGRLSGEEIANIMADTFITSLQHGQPTHSESNGKN